MNEEFEEFEKVLNPVIKYMEEKKFNPHQKIIINIYGAQILTENIAIAFTCKKGE